MAQQIHAAEGGSEEGRPCSRPPYVDAGSAPDQGLYEAHVLIAQAGFGDGAIDVEGEVACAMAAPVRCASAWAKLRSLTMYAALPVGR